MDKANNKGKITVGRPRPDFIDRCQPPADAHDPIFGMSNYTICTTPMDTHMMIDGFKSFPSGHSSCKEKFRRTNLDDQHEINMYLALVSFAGLAYLAFYIAGKMQMFDERGVSSNRMKHIRYHLSSYGYLLDHI